MPEPVIIPGPPPAPAGTATGTNLTVNSPPTGRQVTLTVAGSVLATVALFVGARLAWAYLAGTPVTPTLTGTEKVTPYGMARFVFGGVDSVLWDVRTAAGLELEPDSDQWSAKDGVHYDFPAAPGDYVVSGIGIHGRDMVRKRANVHFEGPTPTPPDPGPKPPDPPPPDPKPPAPIPGAGLRVLMIYESSEVSKYPARQASALYDRGLRTYLDSATAASPSGSHEWRLFDKDADVSHESDAWKAAMGRPHPTLPWIVISNGTTGFEGPLPADADAVRALVQKYEVKP